MPKDLEVKIVATIKEEIIEEVVNDLNEIKLDDSTLKLLLFWWEIPNKSLLILLG